MKQKNKEEPEHRQNVFSKLDSSFWSLLIINLSTIVFAVMQNWELSVIIWIYWSQSVIIGIFTVIKIALAKHFYNDKIKKNYPTEAIYKIIYIPFFFTSLRNVSHSICRIHLVSV